MLKTISTPGRICLFGEHLDYLGLPVIAAAISLRVAVSGIPRSDNQVVIHLPDIGQQEVFELSGKRLPYTKPRDYFRSSLNVLLDAGLQFTHGIEATVRGNIPLNSGTSSSSALIASWLGLLMTLADHPPHWNAQRIGELAYRAEVLEFGEPGGMMDHYATALGNVIYLESEPEIRVQTLMPTFGSFVLGDSLEPKDTLGILARVKQGMLRLVARIQETTPHFSLHTATFPEIQSYSHLLTDDEKQLLEGTLHNRDLLRQALALLQQPETDHLAFGKLLTLHHHYLRDAQRISTPKIDRMLDAALQAGALGGKINGSGGGGCMFAYAPQHPEKVANAIEKAGGNAFVIQVDEGIRID